MGLGILLFVFAEESWILLSCACDRLTRPSTSSSASFVILSSKRGRLIVRLFEIIAFVAFTVFVFVGCGRSSAVGLLCLRVSRTDVN